MGNRLRLRTPSNPGAGCAAELARYVGIAARVVRPAVEQRQKVDEVLAGRAWGVDLAHGYRVPDLAALRGTIRNAGAAVVVVAASITEGRACESTTCVQALHGTFAFPRPARIISR